MTDDNPSTLILNSHKSTGIFAIQLAVYMGAHVIATASSHNHPLLQQLGANECIDYHQTDFTQAIRKNHPNGIDTVLDCVGGETAAKSIEIIRDNGRFVTIVDLNQVIATRGITPRLLYFRLDGQQLTTLVQLVEQGQIKTHLGQVLPLADAKIAHQELETLHPQGKCILLPPLA